ncbi:hypothetical protein O3M35_004474 [Rhynocoris fuscipes]|uniref:MD-2-related lipid-recognition domain-containing protein n=1 Tax=Rhynocoris fuscipes TaxID=488301 RepID=A0AAW1CKW2_9HEMI
MGIQTRLYTFLFLFVILFLVKIESKYSDCGSTIGEFTSVNISSCSEQSIFCPLKRGTSVNLSVGIHTKKEIEQINVRVHGIIAGIPVPFKVPQPDACHNSGLICPLPENYNETYTATLPILNKYPKIAVTVLWELLNENQEKIICISIPAKII